jgi:hypothetical protein
MSEDSSREQLASDLAGDIADFLSNWTEHVYISEEARKKIEELAAIMALDIQASGYDPPEDFESDEELFANMDQFSGSSSD